MLKTTPGPWGYDRSDGSIKCLNPDSDRHTVGRFHLGRHDDGNNAKPILADGQLMAAAPDLYGALEEGIGFVIAWLPHLYGDPNPDAENRLEQAKACAERARPRWQGREVSPSEHP